MIGTCRLSNIDVEFDCILMDLHMPVGKHFSTFQFK